MNAPRIWIEKLVQRAKRDPGYHVDAGIDARSVISVLGRRGSMFLRGSLQKWTWRHAGKMIFVGKGTRIFHGHQLSVGNGFVLDDYATIDALSVEGVTVGDNVTIDRYATLRVSGNMRELGKGIRIGNDTGIGAYCYIGAAGGIEIGNNVQFGQRINLHAENHLFDDPDKPIREQGTTRRGIRIEDDCWIGSCSVILDGVTIGKGAVIAAGSVVTKDIAPFAVVAGVPAKVLRQRGQPQKDTLVPDNT